jgi:hypothetical protein
LDAVVVSAFRRMARRSIAAHPARMGRLQAAGTAFAEM